MASPVIISRVRATLHRLGYQGISQEQIIEVANILNVDINNPTAEDTKAVASKLIELLPTNETSNIAIEKSDSELLNDALDSKLITGTNEEIDYAMLASLPKQEITQSGKEVMVTRIARDLNVDISREAIINIASQFDAGIKNAQEQRQALETAIIAYFDYQIAQEQKEQNQSITRMVDSYKTSVTALNQNLTSFTSELNTALEVGRDANKSAFANLLKQFAVPEEQTKV